MPKRSKDKLVYDADHHGKWRIHWAIAEWDWEYGATLGDRKYSRSGLQRVINAGDEEDIDAMLAGLVAQDLNPGKDEWGFYWESKKDVAAALKQIQIGMKEYKKNGCRPMPAWAKTALANGWKPPVDWDKKLK